MFAVAETLAIQEGAKALVTGESLGQVASQTLDNIRAVNDVVELPVLRPLIGMDKLQIIAMAEQLNTFEISSQAHDDCCTLFIPRNPETHARLATVQAIWEDLPVTDWLRNIMDEIEFIDTKSVSQTVEEFTVTGGDTGGDTGSDTGGDTGGDTVGTKQGRGD
jgi:thiamine biosynthesis protein ThiI